MKRTKILSFTLIFALLLSMVQISVSAEVVVNKLDGKNFSLANTAAKMTGATDDVDGDGEYYYYSSETRNDNNYACGRYTSIPVEAGKLYFVSAWVKLDQTGTHKAQIRVETHGQCNEIDTGLNSTYPSTAGVILSSTDWKQVYGWYYCTATIDSDATNLTTPCVHLSVETLNTGGNRVKTTKVKIDKFEMYEMDPSMVVSGNIMANNNPGFEQGYETTNWGRTDDGTNKGSTTAVEMNPFAHSGQKSLYVVKPTGNTKTMAGITTKYVVATDVNSYYYASAYVKSATASASTMNIGMQGESNTTVIGQTNGAPKVLSTTAWTKVDGVFKTGSETQKVKVYLEDDDLSRNYYADDFAVVKLALNTNTPVALNGGSLELSIPTGTMALDTSNVSVVDEDGAVVENAVTAVAQDATKATVTLGALEGSSTYTLRLDATDYTTKQDIKNLDFSFTTEAAPEPADPVVLSKTASAINCVFTNNTTAPVTVMVAAASYDSTGKMTDVKMNVSAEVAIGATSNTITVDIPTGDNVKVMVWNLNGFIPLCNATPIADIQ